MLDNWLDPKANYLTLQILLLRVDIIPVLNKEHFFESRKLF